MFNTNNLIKFGASAAGALLILLFANWAASAMFTVAADGAHGDEDHAEPARGYVIAAMEAEGDGGDEAAVEVPFAEILAAADPAAGEKGFKKCQSCHSIAAGENGTGPSLHGVVDRPIGSVAGFAYSDGLASHGGSWTPEELNKWLEDPKAYSAGSKMVLKTKKVEDRADLIAYLATLSD